MDDLYCLITQKVESYWGASIEMAAGRKSLLCLMERNKSDYPESQFRVFAFPSWKELDPAAIIEFKEKQ